MNTQERGGGRTMSSRMAMNQPLSAWEFSASRAKQSIIVSNTSSNSNKDNSNSTSTSNTTSDTNSNNSNTTKDSNNTNTNSNTTDNKR